MVPATAVPSDEPRLDTLRDSPEISPWCSSGKLDCTTLTDGVSIAPTPRPMRRSPGRERPDARGAGHQGEQDADPASVTTKPAMMRVRCGYRLARRSAASDDTRMPTVAAVKITPVWMAL